MTSPSATTSAPIAGTRPADYRLPDQTRVGGVHLQVANLERSLSYYRDVVGLRALAMSADTASLGVPGTDEALVTLHAVEGSRPVPRRGTFGLYHFAILLPDRAALGGFVAHLAATGVRAGMSDHLVSEAIYLTDPDGLGIEVYADRPREQWQYAGGQLVMAAEPLDVGSLVAAAGGAAWNGMPNGTRMGHVHLHVGGLEEAAVFYHRALGFDITVWNYPGALFFSAGGYHHHLGANTWSPGPAPTPDQARLLEWTLVVPSASDADSAGRRVIDAGYPAATDDAAWRVADPWGTPLKIVAATPMG